MGGGSSVLSPHLSKSLTQPSLNEFHRFQLECESRHLTPVEMYLYLSHKYEELLAGEKSAVKEIANVMRKDRKEQHDQQLLSDSTAAAAAASSSSSAAVKTPPPHLHVKQTVAEHAGDEEKSTSLRRREKGDGDCRRDKGGLSPSHHARPSAREKTAAPTSMILLNGKVVPIATSSQMEENAIQEELQIELAAMATEEEFKYRECEDDNKDTQSHYVHDPYLESVVGKVFNVNDTMTGKSSKVKDLVNKLMPSSPTSAAVRKREMLAAYHLSSTSLEQQPDDVPDTATEFVIDDAIIHHDPITDKYTCAVCQLSFDGRRNLDIHLEHSPLHVMNLKVRHEIFQGTVHEAERLGKLAKLAINRIMGLTSTENKPTAVVEHTDVPAAEGHSVEAQHRWKRAVHKVISHRLKQHYMPIIEELFDTPTGVKMLYAGEKLFYQVKAHVDIHVYLHIAFDVVEIVAHTLPNRKQREKVKAKVAHSLKHHNHEVKEVDIFHTEEPDVHEYDYLKAFIKPLQRLYLDYALLVPMVLGIDRAESGLVMDPNATIMQAHLKNQIESNQFISGITSRYAAMGNGNSNDASEARKMSKTIEQAIVSFILNRLKVNIENAESKDPASKFSISMEVATFSTNPMMSIGQLQADLKPVPLTEEKLRKHYDRKLHEEVAHDNEAAVIKQTA